MKALKTCFAPVIGDKPRILILGSMPGEKSLMDQQYYAHPRNAFWFIMQELFAIPLDMAYEQRLEGLKQNSIALWDVLNSCERQGSLDSSIKNHSIIGNNFAELLSRHNTIQLIAFNGAKAETEFKKRISPTLTEAAQKIRKVRLPSTSPAMASLTKEEKLEQWRVLLSS